jgi:hypothetical protein
MCRGIPVGVVPNDDDVEFRCGNELAIAALDVF